LDKIGQLWIAMEIQSLNLQKIRKNLVFANLIITQLQKPKKTMSLAFIHDKNNIFLNHSYYFKA